MRLSIWAKNFFSSSVCFFLFMVGSAYCLSASLRMFLSSLLSISFIAIFLFLSFVKNTIKVLVKLLLIVWSNFISFTRHYSCLHIIQAAKTARNTIKLVIKNVFIYTSIFLRMWQITSTVHPLPSIL